MAPARRKREAGPSKRPKRTTDLEGPSRAFNPGQNRLPIPRYLRERCLRTTLPWHFTNHHAETLLVLAFFLDAVSGKGMGFEQLAELKKQLTREAKAKAREKAEAAKPQSSGAPTQKPAQKQGQKPARGPRPAKAARPHAGAPAQAKPPAPQVDPVVHVIGKLQKRFPAAFPKNPAPKVPLKIGILADLVAQAESLKLSEDEIREAVSTWCRGSRYWACLTDGAARVDLNGAPAGVVTTRDATFARKQARQATGGPRRKGAGKPAAANAPAAEAPAADAAPSTDAPAEPAPEAATPQAADNSEA